MSGARPSFPTSGLDASRAIPILLAVVGFAMLFRVPAYTLVRDWWVKPDASHGLLLGPLALWLAWRAGLTPRPNPWPVVGLVTLGVAIVFRFVSELAAEPFVMRMSMLMAIGGVIVAYLGPRQLARWWLPCALLALTVPIPAIVMTQLALPLQLKASAIGAGLLQARDVPVLVAGNVIHLPGQSLFVSEACSGLRSLTALISLGLLLGGVFLTSGWARTVVMLVTVPLAVLVNGIRVFLIGFLVYFVDPAFGSGFLHYTEGWALFVISFAVVGGVTYLLSGVEEKLAARRPRGGPPPSVGPLHAETLA